MKLIATQAFSWAHRGVEIAHYQAGEGIDTEDTDLIDVAIREGWASPDGEKPIEPPGDEAEVAENKPPRAKRATK
jgi:hypothetical protein